MRFLHRLIVVALLSLATVTLFAASEVDDFNRASIGSNWTSDVAGMAIVSSSLVRATGGATWNSMAYTGTTFISNQSSSVKVTGVVGSFGGPAVRMQPGGAQTYYFLQTKIFIGNVSLVKVLSGTRTELVDYGVGSQDGHTYRLEAEGTTLRAYDNGSQIGTDTTDASITGGQPGLAARSDNGADLDDWAGADLGGGGGGGGGGTHKRRRLRGVGDLRNLLIH